MLRRAAHGYQNFEGSAGSVFRFVEIIQLELLFLCTISVSTVFQHDLNRSHVEILIGLYDAFEILAQKFISHWLISHRYETELCYLASY
jgi:hypothetical protein